MGLVQLTPAEARVLGCLIEKQLTTPEAYPLTLNSLRLACCQKSNRDPVVDMEEKDVLRAVDGLLVKKLACLTTPAGSRVPKYQHRLQDTLPLTPTGVAILTELLLRGPQTIGELRNRASRMHPLASLEEVEATLTSMMTHECGALVAKLPLQPGRKEPRHAHLLAGEPQIPAESTPSVRPEPARVELQAEDERVARLEAEVRALRAEVDALRTALDAFKAKFE
jgi:uncharacterized protein